MPEWLTHFEPLIRHYGLPGLFVDVFLEALGAPLPGETLLIFAAGLAALGQLNIYSVAVTAFFAAVTGDNVGYLIGRKLGRPLIIHHGSRFGITHERLKKVEDIIQKHGPIIVAMARFVVLLRQLNGIAAGTAGMHWLRFLIANAVGAALWVGFWTTLAFHFGKDATTLLPEIWHQLSRLAIFIVPGVVIVAAIATLVFWLRSRRSASRRPPSQ